MEAELAELKFATLVSAPCADCRTNRPSLVKFSVASAETEDCLDWLSKLQSFEESQQEKLQQKIHCLACRIQRHIDQKVIAMKSQW